MHSRVLVSDVSLHTELTEQYFYDSTQDNHHALVFPRVALVRPCAYLGRSAAASRIVRLMRTAKRETTAYFESLNIQSTGDVVRHWVQTTSVSADLVRGPGGKGEASRAVHKAIEEAKTVCNSFLPRALRDEKSVSQILGLLGNALSLAGDPSSRDAFAALESVLVSFHDTAPVAMRKALQGRFSGIAESWTHRCTHKHTAESTVEG